DGGPAALAREGAMKSVLFLLVSVALLVAPQTRDAGGGGRPVGRAVIAGVVITGEPQREPVRRAIVTLTGAELPLGRTVVSDDAGRFAFASLPAGRYTL